MKYTRSFSGLGEAPFIKTANQLASSKMLHHGFRHLLNIPWMSRHSIRSSGSRDPFIAATVSSLGSWAYPLSSSLRSWTRDCRFFSERTRIRRYRFFRGFMFCCGPRSSFAAPLAPRSSVAKRAFPARGKALLKKQPRRFYDCAEDFRWWRRGACRGIHDGKVPSHHLLSNPPLARRCAPWTMRQGNGVFGSATYFERDAFPLSLEFSPE